MHPNVYIMLSEYCKLYPQDMDKKGQIHNSLVHSV